jgi:NTP pyrophosphatase (non-canonical NTP hydrolase)
MKLDEMQVIVDKWIKDTGGYWDKFQILTQLTEELGEVARALQREAGLRPRKSESDLESEVGDLLFTLAVFANASGLKLDRCINRTMLKYKERDEEDWKNKEAT